MESKQIADERSKGADLRSAVIFTSWVQTPPNAHLFSPSDLLEVIVAAKPESQTPRGTPHVLFVV